MSRTGLALALVVTALLTAGSSTAAHAQSKSYSVRLSPLTSAAGPSQVFDAEIKNLSTSAIGSLDLRAPAYAPAGTGFLVRSVTVLPGAQPAHTVATTDGTTVRVRQSHLPRGATMVLRMVVDTTTVTGAWAWTVAARQAKDFGGPHDDFTLDAGASALTTTVTSAPGGTVASCPEEPAGDTARCRLTLSYRTAGFTITLLAESDPAAPGNAGALRGRMPSPVNLDCPGLTERSPVTGLVDGPPNRTKTVTFTIDATADLPGVPPGLCYAGPLPNAPNPAFPAPGSPFAFEGQVLFPSVLPDCSVPLDRFHACTSSRRNEAGDWVLVVSTPPLYPDPMYRG